MKLSLPLLLLFISIEVFAQLPNPSLIGYFHNWQDATAPYIQLDQVDSRYNVVNISFAVPQTGTNYKMVFVPDQVSQSIFISQIQSLQQQGRKVVISIGGATAPVILNSLAERDTFVQTMSDIINTYGFDGIDIDLESGSISVTGGTITSPIDQPIINLIDAIKQIMQDYYSAHNHKLLLTMAPEAAYVQGGMSAYGGIWGGYLPVIDALRDSLDALHVQLYNTGSLLGIDGQTYSQGTADFIVAMTEALTQGFNTAGGHFDSLPQNKVAIGLPACLQAAGGGFTDTATVKSAVDYLMGNGQQPGSYVLQSSYPNLLGLMTWSINWDATSNCNSTYEFASNFENIFGSTANVTSVKENSINITPNPASDFIKVSFVSENKKNKLTITNNMGKIVLEKIITDNSSIQLPVLSPGIYFVSINNRQQKLMIE